MIVAVAGGWSAILYFGLLLRSKYKLTIPPYRRFLVFACAGFVSTIPAATFNAAILDRTALNFFETSDLRLGVLGIFLAPGLGEEFWKGAAALVAVICFNRRERPLEPAECVLGFATVGLVFGSVENIISYDTGHGGYLLMRGLIAVPLHACMCMIQAMGLLCCWRRRSIIPLFGFYLLAAFLHGLWDIASIYGSSIRAYWLPAGVLTIYTTALLIWRSVPESASGSEATDS